MFIGKKLQEFFDSLTNDDGLNLKGEGKPSYHLGGDFFRDPDGAFAWGAHSYVVHRRGQGRRPVQRGVEDPGPGQGQALEPVHRRQRQEEGRAGRQEQDLIGNLSLRA